MGGDRSNYPEHSRRILDLKDRLDGGINHFFNYMVDKIPAANATAVAVVPSSNATKGPTTGVHILGQRLSDANEMIDAGMCLVRHTSIRKKAHGGDRGIEVDLQSIRVEEHWLIGGETILLLDDVTSTGNSLLACRRLLLQAGAAAVKMVALSRTAH